MKIKMSKNTSMTKIIGEEGIKNLYHRIRRIKREMQVSKMEERQGKRKNQKRNINEMLKAFNCIHYFYSIYI